MAIKLGEQLCVTCGVVENKSDFTATDGDRKRYLSFHLAYMGGRLKVVCDTETQAAEFGGLVNGQPYVVQTSAPTQPGERDATKGVNGVAKLVTIKPYGEEAGQAASAARRAA